MQQLILRKMIKCLFFIAIVAICACAEPVDYDVDVPSLTKVINGQAEFGEPGTVALGYGQNGSIGCTGTLIAPRTVLTAAHCIFTQKSGYQVPAVIGVFMNGRFSEVLEVGPVVADGLLGLQDPPQADLKEIE